MDVATPAVLAGRYEIGPVLGRGGMGEVRRAYDQRLSRYVAVKLFPLLESARDRARFEAEARAAAAVTHPNVVAVHDVGTDPVPFLVMECLKGGTLADELRREPLPVERALDIVDEILAGLGAAHAKGVIHRDLKPANVLFTDDGRPKLGDFGIAISLDAVTLTETGIVIGTPAYVAPERLEGEPATVESDLYSVSVMLYEALAGRRPFEGDSPLAVAYAAHQREAKPLHEVTDDIPQQLSAVVGRAMAKSPAQRYHSAAEFADALRSATRHDAVARGDAHPEDETVPVTVAESYTPTRRLPIAVEPPSTRREPPVPEGRRKRRVVHATLLGLAALLALLWGAYAASDDTPPRDQRAPESSAPTSIPLPPALESPFDELDKAVRP